MTGNRHAANAEQAERWNGESGQFWIANRERHLAGHRRLVRHLLAAAAIRPGERVVDIGCGCGATTIAAARAAEGRTPAGLRTPPHAGPAATGGTAIGLDLSRPMLGVARQLASQSGTANAMFAQCDAQRCPLREGSCDVAISSFGVMFFDDPAAAFKAIARAVRPRGRLAFLCWQHDTSNELLTLPIRAFTQQAPQPGPATAELFTDPAQVEVLLSRTGWAGINITPVRELAWMGSDVPDVMRYVRAMPLIRGLTRQLASRQLANEALATVAREYAARQQPSGVWVRAAAWLVTGHRS